MSNISRVSYPEFVAGVKAEGAKHLSRDVTDWGGGKKYDKVLYAMKGQQLVGWWSPIDGGFIKGLRHWSTKGRTFEKVKFEEVVV